MLSREDSFLKAEVQADVQAKFERILRGMPEASAEGRRVDEVK